MKITRTCRKCKKPWSQVVKTTKRYTRIGFPKKVCPPCKRQAYDAHVEKMCQFQREYPDTVYARHLKRAYGITLVEFNNKLQKQGCKCAACGTSDPGKRGWCLDHSHDDDSNRDILCQRCNMVLGQVRESIVILKALIAYLERWAR